MTEAEIAPWGGNWAWGLPLILLTVVIHVFGLALINDRVVRVLRRTTRRRSFIPLFAIVMAAAVLLATALHGVEAVAWAAAYRFLGAVPDGKSAMLYSLNAMTTYGHESVSLAQQTICLSPGFAPIPGKAWVLRQCGEEVRRQGRQRRASSSNIALVSNFNRIGCTTGRTVS